MSGSTESGVRTYARILGWQVAEIISTEHDPADTYHGAIKWVEVSGLSPEPQQGWGYDGRAFTPPAPLPPPAPSTKLSPLQFMGRLTQAEDMAIAAAAQSNTQVLLWLLQMSAALDIDLADPRTVAGVNALVAAGLLTADRAKVVLTP